VEALLANRRNRVEEDVSEMRGEKIGRMELEGCRGEAGAHLNWRWKSSVSAGFDEEINAA
jgi:hypothetical protein